ETRHGHPAQRIEAMLALAGALTTFSAEILPQNLPTYDHADLSRCFGALEHDVFQLLDTVLPTNCVTLPLELREEGNLRAYAVSLGDDRYLAADELYLAVQVDMRDTELLSHASALKVSSIEHVEEVAQQS